MFSRTGAISRSFNAPHGMRINVAKQQGRIWRKSWSTGRLRHASSEGALARQPVILKEGYLFKPSFFRFGGRKRRWCVLRTFSPNEASIDLYVDETKTRYKGSISLDKDSAPMLVVKNADKKRKVMRQSYIVLKVAKNTFQFTCDSFRELTEWCALIRQAMDVGNTFSGIVTEPASIADGPVNVKFTANCIMILCPITETSIKTWLLHKITSFGQCGGILTFECCSHCCESTSSLTRCCINLIQEKPTMILNIMERAIRTNPNTSEIHYERSILGDIYHCAHDCGQPGRLMPAFSDPNLFRGGSISPQKTRLPSIDLIDTENPGTLESSDSGLPGTPQADESISLSSGGIPSPTTSNKSNPREFRSPRHQYRQHRSPSVEEDGRRVHSRARRSDEVPCSPSYSVGRTFSDSQAMQSPMKHARLNYAMITHDPTPKLVHSGDFSDSYKSVPYATVQTEEQQNRINPLARQSNSLPKERHNGYNKLRTLEESFEADDVIYDVPNCEPLTNPFTPSSTPSHSCRDSHSHSKSPPNLRHSSMSPINGYHRTSPTSAVLNLRSPLHCYTPGLDLQDREEDYEDPPPPLPKHKSPRHQVSYQPVKAPVNINSANPNLPRRRLQSSSDILDVPKSSSFDGQKGKGRSSVDDLQVHAKRSRSQSTTNGYDRQLEKASNDFLKRLHEEEEKLSKVLAASRKERNDEFGEEEARDRVTELNRSYKFSLDDFDYENVDPDLILETCSNLVDYHSPRSQPNYLPSSQRHDRAHDRVLMKEASNNVRGYAYKVQIPYTQTQYDVPRKTAAAPDLSNVRFDAPPKPKRYTSSEHLHFISNN